MTGINTVKAVAAEPELRWRWEERLTKQMNVQFKAQKLGINLEFVRLINSIGSTSPYFGLVQSFSNSRSINYWSVCRL